MSALFKNGAGFDSLFSSRFQLDFTIFLIAGTTTSPWRLSKQPSENDMGEPFLLFSLEYLADIVFFRLVGDRLLDALPAACRSMLSALSRFTVYILCDFLIFECERSSRGAIFDRVRRPRIGQICLPSPRLRRRARQFGCAGQFAHSFLRIRHVCVHPSLRGEQPGR